MFTCIYRKTPFSTATREHILQNSMGARWDSAEIVCDDVQQQFSSSIDKALEMGFKEIRVLIGTEGGRGGEPRSLKIGTTEGRTVLVQSGGSAKLAEPRVEPVPGRPDSYHLEMSSIRDAGWIAKKICDLYPNLDMAGLIAGLEEALKTPPTPRSDPVDKLKLRVELGGEEFFRGVLKAVFNLLGVSNPTLALNPLFDPARAFILEGTGNSRTFARWPINGPTLPTLGEFDHFIAIYSRAGQVEAFAQFFGAIHWAFKLARACAGLEFCYAYAVDPLREADPAEDRAPNVTSESFVPFEQGRPEQDDDVRRYGQAQLESLLRRYVARSYRNELNSELTKAIQNAWRLADGRVLTQADVDRVTQAVQELLLRRL